MSVREQWASAAATQTFLEKLPKLCVEDGVDDGIEGTIDVTQPGDDADQSRRDVAGRAQGSHCVDHKEWSPAEQEAA